MPVLRVALGQCRLIVGDLPGNAAVATDLARRAVAAGADVLVLPEMHLTGYMPEDLVLRRSFLQATERTLEQLTGELPPELLVLVGLAGTQPGTGRPTNEAAFIHGGRIVARYAKHHLPNYGVFDEYRYFARGDAFPVVRFKGVDIGAVICEDLWQDHGPVSVARAAGVDLVLCPNGSPWERGKGRQRAESIVGPRAREAGAAIAYVNQVGGQDELVYDGQSFVVDGSGQLVARSPQFVEDLLLADLELADRPAAVRNGPVDVGDGTFMTVSRHELPGQVPAGRERLPRSIAPQLPLHNEIWQALVVATRDYVEKNGFKSVVLGLSGGIDSAVVATIAVDALGAERVHTVALPSAYSSQHSLDDAAELARRQGTQHQVIRIAPVVDGFHLALEGSGGLHGLAEENLQARVRGTTLMALSNEHGHLVLTTGNKSELATGFSTLYGDSAGGFAPIKDVEKSLVWELARWRNDATPDAPPIPENSITKPPSAELAPGQLDSDRLPDYTVLDRVLDGYVEQDLGRAELIERGEDPQVVDRVIRLVDGAEYKRRQYPPGPKTTMKAFGRDRRLPITSKWREQPGDG
jgi:NAD+ synthase (glutamine-hydrolysing)